MEKTKFVVHEKFAGKRKPEEVFAAVFLSNAAALTEHAKSSRVKNKRHRPISGFTLFRERGRIWNK